MSTTHWTRPHVDGDPDEGLVVHTPEEAVHCQRTADGWLAQVHTATAAVVLQRKRWQQVPQAPLQAPPPQAESRRTRRTRGR